MAVRKKTAKKKSSKKKKAAAKNKAAPPKTAKKAAKKKSAKAKQQAHRKAPKDSTSHGLSPMLKTFPESSQKPANWLSRVFQKRRPHGSLSEKDAGKTVCVAGWALRYRDQGGCVFVDLRDRTEIIQLMFDSSELGESFHLAESIRTEYVLAVEGKLRRRSKENVNPKLKNGNIEILVKKFEILNRSEPPPVSPDEYKEAGEEIRLKHRYLDLRRSELRDAMFYRSRLNMALRRFLEEDGFIEVETPVLNKSTPEGARDFLVPSRMHPGEFFALPQSPQLFKQILMVGGIEKYFQIVKCFRDEDLRADRQPEFTQLDLEMSFVDENLIMENMERLWARVLPELFGINWPDRIPRLPYAEAMERYGKDAPDLRFGMPLVDVADIAQESEFQVFKQVIQSGGRVKVLAVPGGAVLSRKDIDDLTAWVSQDFGAKGLAWMKHEAGGLKSVITKFFSEGQLSELARLCKTKEGDILFFGAGRADIVHATLGNLRERLARRLDLIPEDVWAPVWITDFPLFETDPQTGEIYSMHHPFTAPRLEDEKRLYDSEFGKDKSAPPVLARAYDLVLNGSEIGGGSVRIFDPKLQQRVFAILGISQTEAEEKFGFFLNALRYGAPPHAGIAFGLDRILMLFLKRPSIREVIAFPKTQKGQCLLSETPSPVDRVQLRELRLSIRGEKANS